MSVTNLSEFPQSWGNRKVGLISITGPSSYTAVTAGTPPAGPTGGQSVPASAFGLKFIEKVVGGLDAAGKYDVIAVGSGGVLESTSATLMWRTAATGAEVSGATDLSTYKVRLLAIGR